MDYRHVLGKFGVMEGLLVLSLLELGAGEDWIDTSALLLAERMPWTTRFAIQKNLYSLRSKGLLEAMKRGKHLMHYRYRLSPKALETLEEE